jgi:hypothetical protein
VLLPNVVLFEMFPRTPLPDDVRKGVASDPQPLSPGPVGLGPAASCLNLEVLGRGLAAVGYFFVLNRLSFIER